MFEERPIVSAFDMPTISYSLPGLVFLSQFSSSPLLGSGIRDGFHPAPPNFNLPWSELNGLSAEKEIRATWSSSEVVDMRCLNLDIVSQTVQGSALQRILTTELVATGSRKRKSSPVSVALPRVTVGKSDDVAKIPDSCLASFHRAHVERIGRQENASLERLEEVNNFRLQRVFQHFGYVANCMCPTRLTVVLCSPSRLPYVNDLRRVARVPLATETILWPWDVQAPSSRLSLLQTTTHALRKAIQSFRQRAQSSSLDILNFKTAAAKARSCLIEVVTSPPTAANKLDESRQPCTWKERQICRELSADLHLAANRERLFFPDKRLLQYDCGKLQKLVLLLRQLK